MKNFICIILVCIFIYSCSSSKQVSNKDELVTTEESRDTIRIANDELEYEIIIIELGFDSWLVTQRPMGFYSQYALEFKNRSNVIEYNLRVIQPFRYGSGLYLQTIDYESHIDYGMEVNYLLYMYLKFFQQKYDQKLVYVR